MFIKVSCKRCDFSLPCTFWSQAVTHGAIHEHQPVTVRGVMTRDEWARTHRDYKSNIPCSAPLANKGHKRAACASPRQRRLDHLDSCGGARMMRFTFINTMQGDFEVHRAGCSDIKKVRKNGQHDVDAESVDQAIDDEVADLNADFGKDCWSRSQFRVLPCTKKRQSPIDIDRAASNEPR